MVTQNMLRTHEGKQVFLVGPKKRFRTALDIIKCLQHIKEQKLLLTCAPNLGLPWPVVVPWPELGAQ